MEEKFKGLIDEGNIDLWQDMNRFFEIELKESEEPGYLSSIDDREVFISVDMEDINPHSFTHELLHLFLKTKEVLIARDLKVYIDEDQNVMALFSDSLKEHLGNCLEHVKMLPLYLDRGYRNDLFVRDYHQKIMDKVQLLALQETYYSNGFYNRDAIDKYIGKFYSMKTSNNPIYEYDSYFRGLKVIDPDLYRCLVLFWQDWQSFEIGDPRKKYQKMFGRFIENLSHWSVGKIILPRKLT